MYLPKRRKAPMPDSNELVAMLRAVIQEALKPVHQELEELKPVRQELQELKHGQERLESKVDKLELRQARLESKVDKLEHGQERLESKVDKLELRMEDEVIEKVRALFDGFTLRGEQIENLQKHLNQRLDSIEIDTGYLVSKVARLEKMAK